jgi:ABC-type multidrug transport system fused ATPase/permease subunit
MRDFLLVWRLLPARRRRQFKGLSLLSIVAGVFEAAAIGSVLPFLVVLSTPDRLFGHPAGQAIARWMGLERAEQLLLPISIAFCIAILVAGAVRLLVLWAGTHVSLAAGSDLGNEIFRRTVHQPYSTHLRRSSTDVIDLLYGGVNTVMFDVLIPIVTIVTGAVMILAITATLVAIDPTVALYSFGGVSLIYGGVALATRSRLTSLGEHEATHHRARLMTIQESLGGMRDVLIHGSQEAYCEMFWRADRRARLTAASKRFIGYSPRYVVEALAMSLVVILAYLLTRQAGGIERIIPVLGAFALAAQRMLPAAQNIFAGWSALKGAGGYLAKVARYLEHTEPVRDEPPEPVHPLPFDHDIVFRQVSYRYSPEAPNAIDSATLQIPAGARVGIIGSSGSGKSTLVDLLMALLDPTEGELRVDGRPIDAQNRRAWQENIAHVPQAVYLADATIAENIAFGVPREQIDLARVEAAARQAQIADYVRAQPDGYDTVVGERGVRLSGGQRQRIGIARALYRRAKVLIFDEATSALDSETERAVMSAIEGLSTDLTIVMIAHRLTTLRGCSQIVELHNGRVSQVGGFADVVGHS